MSSNLKSIGERIKKARLMHGINQADLADQLDIAVSYMSSIENGKANFSVDILVKIAEALQVSADELLRPDIPSTNNIYSSELDSLMEGCTTSEKEALLKALRSMKAAFKETK